MSGVLSRLYRGETTFNFVGRRWWGFGLSLFLIVVTMLSLFTRGLNLGIDFEGGVAWEVPAASITIADVTDILETNGVDTADAKIQSLNGSDGPRIRVQVAEQNDATKSAVQGELAAKAKVDVQDVSVSSVSSSWGRSITEKAVRALLIFFVLVSIFIAWRFEWKMALSAILAMAHDVLISVGVYSVTGLAVTPATSRFFSVRHNRGVRQGARQHCKVFGFKGFVCRHHKRVDEPGVDAINQHFARCCSSRAFFACPWFLGVGRRRPRGVCDCAVSWPLAWCLFFNFRCHSAVGSFQDT